MKSQGKSANFMSPTFGSQIAYSFVVRFIVFPSSAKLMCQLSFEYLVCFRESLVLPDNDSRLYTAVKMSSVI